jgi:hypothetical protein
VRVGFGFGLGFAVCVGFGLGFGFLDAGGEVGVVGDGVGEVATVGAADGVSGAAPFELPLDP